MIKKRDKDDKEERSQYRINQQGALKSLMTLSSALCDYGEQRITM